MTDFPLNAIDIRIGMLSYIGPRALMSSVPMEDIWNYGKCRDLVDYGALIRDYLVVLS
jgi:hypothetical protein